MLSRLLHHFQSVHFDPVDPLGDGLREEIEAERREPEAIILEDTIDEESLGTYLTQVVEEDEPSA